MTKQWTVDILVIHCKSQAKVGAKAALHVLKRLDGLY